MIKKHALAIAFLIAVLIAVNVFYFGSVQSAGKRQQAIVARVIDGDTLKTAGGETIRLLNINSPEKGTIRAEEALNFLKMFENKSIELEITGTDKYKRTLARIYTPDYLNLEMVELGLAPKFLVQENELKKFANAEENAVKNSLGIWKKSEFFNCFSADIDEKAEIVTLNAKCGEINLAGWLLKDESRKTYKFSSITAGKIKIHSGKGESNQTDLFWNSDAAIWNNDRDTLYLFDSRGGIAHHEAYGY